MKIIVRIFAFAVCVAALCAASPSPKEDAEQAVRALMEGGLSKEKVDEAGRKIDAAAAREPANQRWQLGKALVLGARDERIAARDLLAKVIEREPRNADYQAWFGWSVFEAIDDTGMLTKLSWASKGRAALEKALELDPGHLRARMGLIEFYLEAPGIAGGSVAKAEEMAKRLATAPGGAFQAHLALARIAAQKKDWAEVDRQFAAAETAPGFRADPMAAMAMRAQSLLGEANDAKAALAVAERMAKIAKPDDVTPGFLIGEAHRKLGNCARAVEEFKRVLAAKPDARNTRFGIAACYEKLGDPAQAALNYAEFARRFPKDPRASDAETAARKLRRE